MKTGFGIKFLSKVTISLAVWLLALPSTALARDYYVHARVGNDANSGQLPNDAFANLGYAMKKLEPGDTLNVRAGIYNDVPELTERHFKSGSIANPIIVRSYGNEQAVITNSRKFIVRDVSWWIFENLTFENSSTLLLGEKKKGQECSSFAENIVFRKNRFQHGRSIAINVHCGRGIAIEDNTFDNLRSRKPGRSLNAVQTSRNAENISVTGNTFRDIGGDGVHLFGKVRDIKITSNTFEVVRPYRYRDVTGTVDVQNPERFGNVGRSAVHIRSKPGGPIEVSENIIRGFSPSVDGQDVAKNHGIGLQIRNNASGIKLQRNHFYDNASHVRIGNGINPGQLPDIETEISNNVFEEMTQLKGATPEALRIWNVRNVQVINNTFYDRNASKKKLLSLRNIGAVELQNNLFFNGLIQVLTKNSYIMEVFSDHNAWSKLTNKLDPLLQGLHDVNMNMVDLDSRFVPSENSPLIDAGASLGVSSDFYGEPITGTTPDIGAVERGSIISTTLTFTTPPTTSTGVKGGGKVSMKEPATTPIAPNSSVSELVQTSSSGPQQAWDEALVTAALRTVSIRQNELPSVAIISPTRFVSGVTEILVQASGAVAIDRVKIFINGVLLGGDLTAPYTFKWDSSTYAGRDVKIEARAIDKFGNKSKHEIFVAVAAANQSPPTPQKIPEEKMIIAASDSMPVNDNASPTVSIVAPAANRSGVMEILVKANDSDGLDRVKLFVDGVLLGGDLTAPYTFTWDYSSYTGRDVRIKALAIDKIGYKGSDEVVLAIPGNSGESPQAKSTVEGSNLSVGGALADNNTVISPAVDQPVSSGKSTADDAELLFVSDFESGRIQGRFENWDGWSIFDRGLKKGIGVQSAVTRAGKYASKYYLEKADWNGTNTTQGEGKPRAQLVKSNQALPFNFDTEYWVGLSTYIPGNWQNDTYETNGTVLWEFHASGAVGPYVPPISLAVNGGKLVLVNHYGDVKKKIETRDLWVGNLEKGRWVDWVIHVNFSLGKGYIQVWKNGSKVVDFSGGPTTFYDGAAPKRDPLYFAMGLYKPKYATMPSSVVSHTLYIDEVRAAKGGASGKQLVTPGASR